MCPHPIRGCIPSTFRAAAGSGGRQRFGPRPTRSNAYDVFFGASVDHSFIAWLPGRSTCTLSSTDVTHFSGM